MSVVFNLKDVHITSKNNTVKIVKEVKYANIIVEKQIVKNVIIKIYVIIIYIKIFVMNVKYII
jgi:hypothetical protein